MSERMDDAVSERVHIFYYNWYGAPPDPEGYVHWPQGGHTPPEQIGASRYPLLAPYSSSNAEVLRQHMAWVRQAGVGVLSLSWWGRDSYEDQRTLPVLDAAAAANLAVNFHLEPYADRTPAHVVSDIAYLIDRYGDHPAFHRARAYEARPVFYVYRTGMASAEVWRMAIDTLGKLPSTPLLLAHTDDLAFIESAGFDGGYLYSIIPTFTEPDELPRWRGLGEAFRRAGKLFVPAVGPGFRDDRAVPGSSRGNHASHTRDDGTAATYRRAWQAATDADAAFVTITSFNEWHQDSQIEPAVPFDTDTYRYPGYAGGPFEYLNLTAELVAQCGWRRSSSGPETPGRTQQESTS